MGKCTRTNKTRPKRCGLETVKQRQKRQLVSAKESSVSEIRVVRRRGPKGERAPAAVARAQPPGGWECRLKALLKVHQQIGELRRRDAADLDAQQRRKVERRDAVLLEIDAILEAHPDARKTESSRSSS
mmetsp:Transcript_20865/g.67211  ORF Transcript_20865/g.67211 Transcript_20865/m.67211 type:complete len:129 (-) Transcript_20865:634-1020(-)